MTTSSPPRAITDALAEAIQRSGKTHYALAKEAGIRPQMLDYFMAGERSLRLETVDKLADALDLTLRPRSR